MRVEREDPSARMLELGEALREERVEAEEAYTVIVEVLVFKEPL